jgi:IclR helix-turn-helix domain
VGMDLPDGITAQTTLGEFAARVAGQSAPTPWGPPLAIGPSDNSSDDEVDDEDRVESPYLGDEVWLHEDIEDELRARQMPYLATAATAAVGYAAWAATALAGAVGGERAGTATATITWVVTAGSVLILWVLRRDRVPDGWGTRWWLAAISATVWVGIAAVHGAASLQMTAALVLGALVLSARWAAEHEVPYPSQIVIEEPEPGAVAAPRPRPVAKVIENEFARRIEHAWQTRVADGDAAKARGSRLANPTSLKNGTRWEVRLDPGRGVGATDLIGMAPGIALALEVGITDLILEVGSRETQAFITVIERDALSVTPEYRGPEYRNGIVPIGLESDGDKEAEYIAWEPGQGVRNGCITGDMGSGKTACGELIMLGLRKSGVWRTWVGDGAPEGGSSNLLMRPGVVHWPASGPEGLLRQLAAFEAMVEYRGNLKGTLTEHPVTGLPVSRTEDDQPELREFAPCTAFPSYKWFIPEFFAACNNAILKENRFAERLEAALRRSRKLGLGVLVDTQSANGGDFGNSPTLRAFLNMVNAIFMKTSNPGEQYSIDGMNVSPGALPAGGGYGLVARRGRVAPMRTYWQKTLHAWVPTLPVCGEEPDAAAAIAPYLPPAEAAGMTLAQRRTALEEWRAKAHAGELPDRTKQDDAASAAPTLAGVTPPAVLGPILSVVPDLPVEPEMSPGLPLSPKAERVLALLRAAGRPMRTAEIAEKTALSKPVVSTALTQELVPAGLVRRPGDVHGTYEAVPVAIQKIPS